MADLPLLTLLLLSLPCGAALIALLPKPAWAKGVALAAVLAALTLAGLAVFRFDAAAGGFQLMDKAVWQVAWPLRVVIGVDGLSLFFLPVTLLLLLAAIVFAWANVSQRPRFFYSLLLLQGGAALGIFMALDGILFLACWLLFLLSLTLLVGYWGDGPHHRRVARRYGVFLFAGFLLLVAGLLVPVFHHAQAGGSLTFYLPRLFGMALPDQIEYLVFGLLLLGFGSLLPIFPLHAGQMAVASQGPANVAALLLGLKLGAYGLIRFAVPLAPDAARDLHWLLAGLGVVAILYGAVAALAQADLRRMLAYLGLSQAGLVLLGIASYSLQGIQGAVLQLLNLTLVMGGLFLLAAALQRRAGSNDIHALGGGARVMPMTAGLFLLLGLAGIGLPLTPGFPAELLILVSALQTHAGAGLAALFGMVLVAACFLGAYRKAFWGPVTSPAAAQAGDLRPAELGVMLLFAAIILAVGLYPAAVLDIIAKSAALWVGRVAG